MKKSWLERTERCLLNLDYKPFTLNVKETNIRGKHSLGKELMSLAIQEKKLLT